MTKHKKEITRLLEKWRNRLLLNEWHIDVVYPIADSNDGREGCSVLASNCVNTAYISMQISIYPAFFNASKYTREKALVHELCHAITQPAWDVMGSLYNGVLTAPHQQIDIIETLTQRVANIALGAK